MKKFLSIIMSLLMIFCLSGCGESFAEQKEALNGSKWYSGSDTKLNTLYVWEFKEDSVDKSFYTVTGNGISGITYTLNYEISEEGIKVVDNNEETIIPYSFNDGKITLQKNEYFTTEDVEKALQGYWTHRSYAFGGYVEYNAHIKNKVITSESAAEAMYGAPGEYYYYGPDTGAFTLEDGKFISSGNTDADEYFFTIYDGKVNLNHYGDVMSKGTGLPGKDGYNFY